MKDNIDLWLKALLIFSPGNKKLWEYSANYDNIEEFIKAVDNRETGEFSDEEYERIEKIKDEDIQKILDKCEEENIGYYSYESEGYPRVLKRIANPPAVLFYKGNLDFLNDKCLIAAVGTRHPSEYSYTVTDKLCGELIKRGFLVCSGFAEGIDQRVNKATIESDGFPVAVCANDICTDYPKGSRELKEIIAQKGVVISEYYPGCPNFAGAFANRNRISVGLSKGVLFIEARADSKGLNNYDHALYQGKPVFVVPPADIFNSRYSGQVKLLRNGCVPVFSAEDIVYEIMKEKSPEISQIKSLGELSFPDEDSAVFSDEKNVSDTKRKRKSYKSKNKTEDNFSAENSGSDQIIREKRDYSSLDETQRKLCETLEERDMLADEIAEKMGMDIGQTLALLTEAEMYGLVESLPGKMFGIR